MRSFWFSMIEAFWSTMIKIELGYGRTRRRIERKWVLRKKADTTWEDVWRYLDTISRRNWSDDHIDRLTRFHGKKQAAWRKKIHFSVR